MLRFVLFLLLLLVVPVLALAQASQPANQPVTPAGILAWFAKWWPLVLVIGIPFLLSVLNALKKYTPKATGLITFLSILLDVISFWGNKDSETGPIIPGLRSKPPTNGSTPAGGVS